jgi:ribosomal-protein-alanine acetyltransferase
MSSKDAQAQVRRMSVADLDCVLEIAASLPEAPHWPASAYFSAMDLENSPRRVAVVLEEIPDGSDVGRADEERTAGAKAQAYATESPARLKSCPDTIPFRADSKQVLGFAVASLLAPEAELETIAVAPRFQRRGFGALLLREVAAELRKEHVREVLLEVRASNRAALGFYRAQGFEKSGRRERYYADPEEDAVLMRLKLM